MPEHTRACWALAHTFFVNGHGRSPKAASASAGHDGSVFRCTPLAFSHVLPRAPVNGRSAAPERLEVRQAEEGEEVVAGQAAQEAVAQRQALREAEAALASVADEAEARNLTPLPAPILAEVSTFRSLNNASCS